MVFLSKKSVFIPEKVLLSIYFLNYTRKGIKLNYMKLQELIKHKRKSLKLTQVQLALKAGVGLRFLRELEQGKETLRMDKVNLVLNLFGMELGPLPQKE